MVTGPRLPELQEPLDSAPRNVNFGIFGMSCPDDLGVSFPTQGVPCFCKISLLKVMSHTEPPFARDKEVSYQPPQVSTPFFVTFLLCIGICEAF